MAAWSRSELWVLGHFRGPEAVAMFGAGLTLASLATQVPLLFSNALLPHFADLQGRADSQSLRSSYADGTRLLALLVMPATALLSALCPVLLPLLYGPEFAAAVPAAAVVIAGAGLAFANVGSAYVYGTGRSSFIAFTAGLGAVTAAAALLWAVPQWGNWGAACARVAVQGSMVAYGCWYIQARLQTPVPVRELLFTAACAAAAGFFAAAVVQRLPSLPGAVIASILFGIVYATGISVSGQIDTRFSALRAGENV
jgi:O-antigen/teichoic acid export membrane protein